MKLICDLCGGELRMQAGKTVCSVCGIEYAEERIQEKQAVNPTEVFQEQSAQKANKTPRKMIVMWVLLAWLAVTVLTVGALCIVGALGSEGSVILPSMLEGTAVWVVIILWIFKPWKYYGGNRK